MLVVSDLAHSLLTEGCKYMQLLLTSMFGFHIRWGAGAGARRCQFRRNGCGEPKKITNKNLHPIPITKYKIPQNSIQVIEIPSHCSDRPFRAAAFPFPMPAACPFGDVPHGWADPSRSACHLCVAGLSGAGEWLIGMWNVLKCESHRIPLLECSLSLLYYCLLLTFSSNIL